jgi:erythromycin esterase
MRSAQLLPLAGVMVVVLATPETRCLFAQQVESPDAFVNWARAQAVPVSTTEPGHDFDDLEPFREMVGSARVVGLGESIHAAHEFFEVRHRLLEFLVEEMGFTAFAMEAAPFAEAVQINEYVLGLREEPESWKGDWFSATFGAEQELQELVRWMRHYNDDPTHDRKLHFYGIDLLAQAVSPLTPLEGVWRFLEEMDPTYADSSRRTLRPLIEPFLGQGGGVRWVSLDAYTLLEVDQRNAYTAAINDLIARVETRRVYYIQRSSAERYEWAYRHAVNARQMDRIYREWAADPQSVPGRISRGAPPEEETASPRDLGMAENIVWALEREGPDGRIVLWAHNTHLSKYPFMWQGFRGTGLGEYLDSMIQDDYLSVGFTYSQGVSSGWASYQTEVSKPAPPGSLDAAMAQVGLPMFILDLRRAPREGPVYEWLNQERQHRESQPQPQFVNPAKAWDVLFHIDRISPARVAPPR